MQTLADYFGVSIFVGGRAFRFKGFSYNIVWLEMCRTGSLVYFILPEAPIVIMQVHVGFRSPWISAVKSLDK